MWLFAKNNKGNWLLVNGKESYIVKKPAICFSYLPDLGPIRGTLLKFGDAIRIKAYFEKTHKLYIEVGLKDEADGLVYMDFEDSFDVNELNKCIEITGYVALFYERSGVSYDEGKGVSI